MTEEAYAKKLREAIKAEFGNRAVVVKIHGGPTQEAGISDLLVFLGGYACAIELKQPGNNPTPLQRNFLDRMAKAGCRAWVVHTDVSTEQIISQLRRVVDYWEVA